MDVEEKMTTHIGTDYLSHIYPIKYTITVEPLENLINCRTTGKILGYIDLVNIDKPVWKNSMCNELVSLYQGWKNMRGQT